MGGCRDWPGTTKPTDRQKKHDANDDNASDQGKEGIGPGAGRGGRHARYLGHIGFKARR